MARSRWRHSFSDRFVFQVLEWQVTLPQETPDHPCLMLHLPLTRQWSKVTLTWCQRPLTLRLDQPEIEDFAIFKFQTLYLFEIFPCLCSEQMQSKYWRHILLKNLCGFLFKYVHSRYLHKTSYNGTNMKLSKLGDFFSLKVLTFHTESWCHASVGCNYQMVILNYHNSGQEKYLQLLKC